MNRHFEKILTGMGVRFDKDGILETTYLSESDFEEIIMTYMTLGLTIQEGYLVREKQDNHPIK